jgi:Spy/CpxP family protein refolding chaperone
MKLRFATLAAVAALAAAPTLAQMGPHGPGPGGPGGPGGPPSILHLADELGLTADQKTQIKAIENRYRDGELGTAMDSMRDARETLGKAIHDATATDDAVTQAASAVATLESQIAVLRHHLVIEVSALLTEEQKAQLAAMKPGAGRGPRRDR